MLKQSTKLMNTHEDNDLIISRTDIALYITASVALSVAIFISTHV